VAFVGGHHYLVIFKQGDPLGCLFFALAHYRDFLETIAWAPSYVFPSLANDTHIVRPLHFLTHAFDHLLIQLAIVGFKVKLSKCKFWSPLRISPSIEMLQGCTLVTNGLCILSVLVGFQGFAMHFLDEVLSQDVMHIDDLFLLGDTHVTLGILYSYASCQPSYLTLIIPPSPFLSFLVSFNRKVMQVCADIMGP
jgi:hypothetical protein